MPAGCVFRRANLCGARLTGMANGEQQNAHNIYSALKSGRMALVSTGLFSFIINLLMLTGPLFMLQVYDRVLNSGSVSTLAALLILAVTLYCLYGFLEFIRSRVMVQVGRQLDEGLRARIRHDEFPCDQGQSPGQEFAHHGLADGLPVRIGTGPVCVF